MQKPIKVTLITSISDILRHTIPWNLLTLAMVARQEGINAGIIDLKTDQGVHHAYQMMFEKLAENVPDVVGLPCSTADVLDVRKIAGQIKKLYPYMVVVVGGIHATLHPEDLFDEDYGVDYAVTGYGEIPFNRLLKALERGDREAAESIPNLVYRGSQGTVRTKETNEAYDLKNLPKMDFTMLDMAYYTTPAEDIIRGVPFSGISIYTTIGCPYKCSFCVSGGLWEIAKEVRYKEVDYVVDEIEYLKNTYKIDGFYIYDDVFILNKKYVHAVCDEIIRRKLNLIWGCQSTVHVIDRDIAAKISKAGCVQLDFGVESGSKEALLRMNKSWAKVEKTRETFKICEEYGIRTLANWMFNTPGETVEDVEETISFAKEIQANTNVFNFFIPWPGGEDGDTYWSKPEHKIDFRDFEKFIRGQSWREHLETIERKFRQSTHDIGFIDIYKRIVREFPVRSNFHFKFSIQWLKQFHRLVSWIHSPWFWRVMFTSSRKKEYLIWLLKTLRKILPQINTTFDDRVKLHLSENLVPSRSPGQSVRID